MPTTSDCALPPSTDHASTFDPTEPGQGSEGDGYAGGNPSVEPTQVQTPEAPSVAAAFGPQLREDGASPAPSVPEVSVAAIQPARSASAPFMVRSPDVVQTSRIEVVSTFEAAIPGRAATPSSPSSAPAPAPASGAIMPGTIPEVAANHEARGPSVPVGTGSPGSPDAQPRPPLSANGPQALLDVRPSVEPATRPARPGDEAQAPPIITNPAGPESSETAEMPTPSPELADMLMNLLPFDRSALDEAVDRFLEPFDDLVPSMPGLGGRIGLISASLTVAATVLAVEVAIRLRREAEDDGDEPGLDRFPGLPRWSRP